MNKTNTQSLSQKARVIARRITFHNRPASYLAAELRVLRLSSGGAYSRAIQMILDTFGNGKTLSDESAKRELIRDILFCRAFYAIEYKEYFLFGLDKGKTPDKRDYVGWYELRYYYSLLDKLGRLEVFDRKVKAYELFKDFYHRELICVSSEEQKQAFLDFLVKNSAGIVKPVDDYGGHGLEMVHASDRKSAEELWKKLRERRPFILEELIEQAPEMNAFYPHAVNTIRYNTFYHDGKLTRLQAVFRIGRGGSITDNATSGGIYTLVDTETGRILCPARSFHNELVERHPDTGVLFEGSVIPRWDELNALVEQVVRVVPEQKQVGWDFALTRDGWVMVEGNTRPALQSFDLDHGLRSLITETFGKVIPMWK